MKIWFEMRPVDIGRTVITQTAFDTLNKDVIGVSLFRHSNGDFGNLGKFDWEQNIISLDTNSGRIVSKYRDDFNKKDFYIITNITDEGNETTILLPEEY